MKTEWSTYCALMVVIFFPFPAKAVELGRDLKFQGVSYVSVSGSLDNFYGYLRADIAIKCADDDFMVGKKYLDTELRQGRMESGQEIFFTDKQQIYCVAKGTPAFSSDQQCPKGWTSTTSPGKWRNLCVNPETVVRYPKELDGTCISKFKEDPNNKNQCLLDQENVKLSKGDAGLTCTPGGKKFLRVDQDLIYFGNLSCKLNGAEFTSDQVACKFKEGATVWSDCWSQVAMLTESDVFETGSGGIKIDINKGAATK